MILLVSLIPISFGILTYIFKRKTTLLVSISYILTFLFLAIFQEGSFVIGNYSGLKGIEFTFDFNIKFLLILFNLFSLITFFRIYKNYDHVFFSLWLLLTGSINGFFMSRDFFNIYVHLELASILTFLLLSYDKNEIRIWAALKYLMMSLVALNFYLIGVGILYSNSGTLNLNYNLSNAINIFAFSFILTGLLTKGGLFFLSGWLPDAHTEAVKGISPILSGIIVKLPLFIVYLLTPSLPNELRVFLYYFAIITAIFASIFTLLQNDIKKFMAYSTMTQMSYGLMVILINPPFFPYFIVFHMFTKGFLFMIAEDIYEKNGTKNLKDLESAQISLDTFLLLIFLLMNLGGLFPFSLYILKDNLSLSYFLEINIYIFGMYFYKLLNIFKVKKKNFEYKYWYMFTFAILNVVSITYYFTTIASNLSILKILTEYLLFAAGILSFILLRKKVALPSIDIYSFENSFIYQMSFLLVALLMEM
ncbi:MULTISPECIES: complex I subunit 5 family protein [Petrotoga]|uniref:Multisubunit sodium/proton antiporter MrpD subunit n=2 Tax=Petrotoga sibirica TaxID=156202 RepID=A0A4R8EKT3_9BACT|nr:MULTISPECIES: proton-conducting transporter membrane subunit [Petrotoga]POZ88479.1 hypothetical protein AA80_05655 [Petrotoga sibirica DSM 13575]POZ91377.1 hypothetical protein AD60_03010 [Petrotoga sp. SL27]TDX11098.1 multisubunit sodium/proton antiporter MrpD subunit [Petrotoga sibirica]